MAQKQHSHSNIVTITWYQLRLWFISHSQIKLNHVTIKPPSLYPGEGGVDLYFTISLEAVYVLYVL